MLLIQRCLFAIIVCGLTLASAVAADSEASHWAAWRGPSGQGYSDDTKVPLTWSEKENVLWKTALPGVGNSSPIVWGDRVFLTAASKDGKERHLVCIGNKDGKVLWQKVVATISDPGKTHGWNGYASPSCTTDGKLVFAFFGTPGLFCYDVDGNLVWKHTFGIFTSNRGWGVGASPFLFEDLLIQNCDNDGAAALLPGEKGAEAAPMDLVAFDKATGKMRWKTARNMGKGFSTPVIINAMGRTEMVLNSPQGVYSYDPRTGKELWHVDRKGDSSFFGEPEPVFTGDMVVAAAGRPGPLQAIRFGGAGDITKTHLAWESVRKGHRDVASPILHGEHVYVGDNKGLLSCYELKTGKTLYNERIGNKALASPVRVRGKLLFLLEDGETVVLEPGAALKVVGRNKLDGAALEYLASPAIADGKIYMRSQTHLYCIGEKK